MANLKFNNVSSSVFQKLTSELSKFGIDIVGDAGNIKAKGFQGSYKRDENEMLDINIDKTPFILPRKLVLKKIQEVIEKNGGKMVS